MQEILEQAHLLTSPSSMGQVSMPKTREMLTLGKAPPLCCSTWRDISCFTIQGQPPPQHTIKVTRA